MLTGLGRGGDSYWWASPRKMRVGAGLRSCGDAVSTAAIWGSDSGLVFLLHNQFAVWIPLHITLNIHLSLDPLKSLLAFLFISLSAKSDHNFTSPSNLEKTLSQSLHKHKASQKTILFLFFHKQQTFFILFYFFSIFSKVCCFYTSPVNSAWLCFWEIWGTLGVIILGCVFVRM